jgi:hypothetical protein
MIAASAMMAANGGVHEWAELARCGQCVGGYSHLSFGRVSLGPPYMRCRAARECRGAAGAQIGKRIAMRGNEIGHVFVIPDTGAVRRRIVGAEDTERRWIIASTRCLAINVATSG